MEEDIKLVKKKTSKILILGLDNSGKTSIVLRLQKKRNLLAYTSLEPTKRFDITELEDLNSQFQIWDFGGQEQYREDHIQNLNSYLTGAKKMIYVIDIQDKDRYDKAIKYLDDIFKVLKEKKSSIKFSIFFHKYDPGLQIADNTILKLQKQIEEKVPPYLSYKIYKTSIFTLFRKVSLI